MSDQRLLAACLPTSTLSTNNCSDLTGRRREIQPGVASGGSHDPVLKSSVRASSRFFPCLATSLVTQATVTVTITVTPTSSLPLTDTAAVTANEADPLPSDNTATVLNGTAPAALALTVPTPVVAAHFSLTATIT